MKNYSPNFGKTLSSGINSLINGKGSYYTLEHLVTSKYHQVGEKQEIILDEVIMGRNTDCHVRFDESFSTVSRYHASIVRDGNNWRLVQLSKKNTTFLNGKAVHDSWFLQTGDEIQLAINGPKLIFRLSSDKSGMNLTQRFDSFKEQVIRPYQTAFVVVCCVIFLIIIGGGVAGVYISEQNENINKQSQIIEDQRIDIDCLKDINDEQRKQIDVLYDQLLQTNMMLEETAIRVDSAQQEAIKAKSEVIKTKAKLIMSQENLQEIQVQMQQLRDEMDHFYNGVIHGEN